MTTTFEPLTPAARASFNDAYLSYLRQRDGVPDRSAHRFDVRERFFAEVDAIPVRWSGPPPVDQAVFDRNHRAARPEPSLDAMTLWALATAKANRAERYGVEYAFNHDAPRQGNRTDDPHVFIEIEEFYHTRILRDALRAIGIEMETLPPRMVSRALVRMMVLLPPAMSNVAVFCGEITGVAIFRLLLEKARELFVAQPAVLERIASLFEQILVDEVGHVHYVRSQLGPSQLRIARGLLPVIARGVLDDIPELAVLFGADRLIRTVVEADVDGAVQSLPGRFVLPT